MPNPMSIADIQRTLGRTVPFGFYQSFLRMEESSWIAGRHYVKWFLEDMLWSWLGKEL